MKAYVVIVNSILLVMMTALALFQTACTPITPSLDRRLFTPKRDSIPNPQTNPPSTAPTAAKTTPMSKEPFRTKAKLFVSIRVNDELLPRDNDDEVNDDSQTCKTSELEYDSVELFKMKEQIDIKIKNPKALNFEFDLVLSPKEAKSFDTKEISIELMPTDSKDIWTLQIAPKQEDPKLAQRVENAIQSILWKTCKNRDFVSAEQIANSSVGVIY